jgi:hypothetical protein
MEQGEVKTTAGRTRKRKGVSSSESEYDVELDVEHTTSSASKKSAGKKAQRTVESVPILICNTLTLWIFIGILLVLCISEIILLVSLSGVIPLCLAYFVAKKGEKNLMFL